MSDTSKNYGEASFSGPSSDNPGKRTQSKLAVELEAKQVGLAAVVAKGHGAVSASANLSREMQDGNVPVAFGHHKNVAGSPSGNVGADSRPVVKRS